MGFGENIHPLPVTPGDLGDRSLPRALFFFPGKQRLPKGCSSDREADEAWHAGGRSEPDMDMLLVLTPAENDAAHVAAPVSAGGFSHACAILATVQSLDLPDVRFDTRLLELSDGAYHQRRPLFEVVAPVVAIDPLQLRWRRRYEQLEHILPRGAVQVTRQLPQPSRLARVHVLVTLRVVADQNLAEG